MLQMQCKGGKIVWVKQMKRYLENIKTGHFGTLHDIALFSGLSDSEIFTFLQHSKPYYLAMSPGQSVSLEKQYLNMISVVVSGEILVTSTDKNGMATYIKTFVKGESSGSLYSFLDYSDSLVEIASRDESEVILIDPDSLYVTDEKIAVIQQKMLVNLIKTQKSIFFAISERMYCLTQRSIRDKILRFLSYCHNLRGRVEFDIPMSREELAGYLAVDRAALSRSLGELKRENIIDFHKNHFKLLKVEYFEAGIYDKENI